MARQRLGQHFLRDEGWRQKIADTLPLRPNETWIEIGPGHGELTELLVGEGRQVVAIEADARLANQLTGRARDESAGAGDALPGLEVISADVLQVDFREVLGEKLKGDKCHVYGNLPYYITSPILHHLFGWAGQIASIHVVIQLEVAARIVAQPGRRDYAYLSAACQFYAKPEIVLRIPPGAFRPPPRVTSALVAMTLPGERATLAIVDQAAFLDFVQRCFSQKRKTLRNNLRAIASEDQIRRALAESGLRTDARAEQLSLQQFGQLFSSLGQVRNSLQRR